ncbi:MAG: hypothetical protein ACI4UN_01030 [Muribaculaceae bacterium]
MTEVRSFIAQQEKNVGKDDFFQVFCGKIATFVHINVFDQLKNSELLYVAGCQKGQCGYHTHL